MNVSTVSNEDLKELYRELILDHARHPRHFGRLHGATHSADGINPLCGDRLTLYVLIDEEDRISEVCFEGTGCAISVASASLLTDTVTGMQTSDALAYFEALVKRLSGTAPATDRGTPTNIDLGKLRALEGVKEFPARVKCATLAWHALHSAINQSRSPASTE